MLLNYASIDLRFLFNVLPRAPVLYLSAGLGILLVALRIFCSAYNPFEFIRLRRRITPISVNFHFSRKCNYSCGFCFHTAKTSHTSSIADSKHVLTLLKREGMRKLNFAGGEPLLYPQYLGELLTFCKEELKLESVSIVTNGSKLNDNFLRKYHRYIDILAVSCDSFNEQTNKIIGRGSGSGIHINHVRNAAALCRKYNIPFKINTVVNKFNFNEDMNAHIQELAPVRWKCFQVLVVKGENAPSSTSSTKQVPLRDATDFIITDEEFELFCKRHSQNKCFVPEPNRLMASSYLILDEYLRFVNRGEPTRPIVEIGVQQALRDAKWDEEGFHERGGVYIWSKELLMSGTSEGCGANAADLEW